MKRCPQCDFIYEDDQSLCDMDGRELVYHAGPVAFEGSSTQPLIHLQENPWAAESLSVSGVVAQQAPPEKRPAARFEQRSQRRADWKRFALSAAAVMLGVLVFLVYHVVSRQNISQPEIQNTKVDAPPALSTSPETPAAVKTTTAADPSSEAMAQDASEAAAANVNDETAENNAKSANTNAPSGRARNVKVPSTSPSASAQPSRELAANKSQPETISLPKEPVAKRENTGAPKDPGPGKHETPIAQNQSKTVKPEDPKAKKESKVSSFFKKAGRILKKPF